MSTLETDLIQASTGTNTAIKIKGKGTGVVKIGDGELAFPDADGSADQIIKTDGSGTLSFVAAAGGGTSVISRATFSGASTVDLTGFDSSTYDAYEVHLYVIVGTDDKRVNLRTSTDGGSTFDTSGYVHVTREIYGASSTVTGVTGTAEIRLIDENRVGNAADESAILTLYINRPDEARDTLFHWSGVNLNNNAVLNLVHGAGQRDSAADVDAIQFLANTGTITGSYVFLGIKKA